MKKNDPGLSTNKSGHFAGLQRIGDPEDGTALWTKLTDPVDIENALRKRASQREEEQLKHDEHIQKMAKEEVEIKEERISEEVKRLPTGMTSNEIIFDELRKMGKAIAARNAVLASEEIAEPIKAAKAKEATTAAKEIAAAKRDTSAAKQDVDAGKQDTSADRILTQRIKRWLGR